MSPIRVLLADDHPVVRAGVRHLLEAAPDIQVVGEARDGNEAVYLAKEIKPDVLLLDMEMPAIDGREVARQLRNSGISIRILIFSAHANKRYIQLLLEKMVSGYMLKEEAPDTLLEAVRGRRA